MTSYAVVGSTTRRAACSTARRIVGHRRRSPRHQCRLGHHGDVQRRLLARLAAVATVLGGAALASSVAMLPAHAACNNVMTYQFDPSTGVVLSPSTLTVAKGACVTLHNATITSAQFTVGAHYKATAQAFSDATPAYVAGPAGTTQAVTATGAAGTAHGKIVVKAAPSKPSPTPSRPSFPPTPKPSSSAHQPTPTPTPTAPRPTPPATT